MLLQLSITEEIEDEEKTIEDYVDEKMSDWDTTSINKTYAIASQCLSEKKNRRPDIKMVYRFSLYGLLNKCILCTGDGGRNKYD